MAAVVQSKTGSSGAAATSLTLTPTTTPTVGNDIVVVAFGRVTTGGISGLAVNDTGSNAYGAAVSTQGGSTGFITVFRVRIAANTGSPFTVTFTLGAGNSGTFFVTVFEVSGLVTTQPDVTPTGSVIGSPFNVATPGSQTPTTTGDFAVGGLILQAGSGTYTWTTPSGFTAAQTNNAALACGEIAYQIASSGAVNPSWTAISPANSSGNSILVLFRAVAGPATARVSQEGVLAITQGNPKVRVSQEGALAIVPNPAALPVAIPGRYLVKRSAAGSPPTTTLQDGELGWNRTLKGLFIGDTNVNLPVAGGEAIQLKTGNYSTVDSDRGSLLSFSGGNYMLTLGSQATGWWVDVVCTSANTLVLSAASTINGAASYAIVSNQLLRIVSLGSGVYVATMASGAGNKALLTGSTTGLYGGLAPGTAGQVVTSDGTQWNSAAPVTSNTVSVTLGTTYTATGTMASINLPFTLTAGTWLLIAQLRVYLPNAATALAARVVNVTDSAVVSGMSGIAANGVGATGYQTVITLAAIYTVTATKSMDVQAQMSGGTGGQVVVDASAPTTVTAVRIA